MKIYKYKAKNIENELVNDIIEAVDKGDVVRKLKLNQLVPLDIKEVKVSKLGQGLNINLTSGVSKKDMVFFLSQLYNLLHAGLGIIDCLKIIIDQTENKYLRKYLLDMLQDIRNGDSLYTAMKNRGKAFPKLMVEMVHVGEAIGNLESIMKDLHAYYEKQMKIEKDIKGALSYPIVLVFATIGVAAFLLTNVIPSIASSLESSGQELPWATKLVINASNVLINYGLYMAIGVVVLIIAGFIYGKSSQGHRTYSTIALYFPLIGKVNRKANLVRISRTLSTLLKNKVNAVGALEITSNTLNNLLFKEIVLKSQNYLENGVPLSKAYEKQKFIDPVFVSMMKIGEETATLDEMLSSLAGYYDAEMDVTIGALKKMLEPIMMVFLVGVVGVIILAIMMPQFSQLSA